MTSIKRNAVEFDIGLGPESREKKLTAPSEKAEGRNWVNGITSSETLECTEHHDQSRASKKGFPSGFIRDSFHERLRLNYKTVTISGSKFRSKHG